MTFLNKCKFQLIAAFFYITCGVYITYPLAFHLGDIATSTKDELLISWIQLSVVKNLTQNPFGLFQGNIFYPYQNTLAYSDLHFTSALLSSVPVMLTGQPITAINFTFVSSLILLGFCTFLLTYLLSKHFLIALLSGVLVMFSPTTLDKNVHVQILAIEWVLLSVLMFLKFLQTRKFRYFLFFSLFFLLQTYNSFLPGFFIIVAVLVLFFFYKRKAKKSFSYYFSKKHWFTLIVTFLLLLPIVLPYIAVSSKFAYVRDIRELVHLSLQPGDLLYPNDLTRLESILRGLAKQSTYPPFTEFKVGYLGLVFSLMAIMSLVYVVWRRKSISLELQSFVTTALIGLLMSFGPALHLSRVTVHEPFLIPLPYAFLYYIVPGLQGIRAVYRWEMLFVLFMAVSSCLVLGNILQRMNPSVRSVIPVLLIILVVAEFHFPMHFVSVRQVSQFPKVYSYLGTLPKNATIVEMPIYNWNMAPYSSDELWRVYYATLHEKRMLNGASGFSPPPWQELVTNILVEFPSEKSIDIFSQMEIDYIIVHKSEYDQLAQDKFSIGGRDIVSGDEVIKQLRVRNDVMFIKAFSDDFVFKLKKEI